MRFSRVWVITILITLSTVSVVYASHIYTEPFELDVNSTSSSYPLQYAGKVQCKPHASSWNYDHKFYLVNATYEMRQSNWKLYSNSSQGRDAITYEPIYGFFPAGQRPFICVGVWAMYSKMGNNPYSFASAVVAIRR